MTAWVETQVPCMLYCGPDLCSCSARWFYEIFEDDEEELEEGDYDYEEYDQSLTQDRKAQRLNRAYNKYLAKLQDWHLNALPEADAEKSKATSTSLDDETGSALKSSTTPKAP